MVVLCFWTTIFNNGNKRLDTVVFNRFSVFVFFSFLFRIRDDPGNTWMASTSWRFVSSALLLMILGAETAFLMRTLSGNVSNYDRGRIAPGVFYSQVL